MPLSGEVDFHRLAPSDSVVVGLNAADGRLLRSDDDGATWTDLGVPGLYDLAIDGEGYWPLALVLRRTGRSGTTLSAWARSLRAAATAREWSVVECM